METVECPTLTGLPPLVRITSSDTAVRRHPPGEVMPLALSRCYEMWASKPSLILELQWWTVWKGTISGDGGLNCSMFKLVSCSQLLALRLAPLAHRTSLESLCYSIFWHHVVVWIILGPYYGVFWLLNVGWVLNMTLKTNSRLNKTRKWDWGNCCCCS